MEHWWTDTTCGNQDFFLQEMKEMGMFKFQWISMATDKADMFTKNLNGP